MNKLELNKELKKLERQLDRTYPNIDESVFKRYTLLVQLAYLPEEA